MQRFVTVVQKESGRVLFILTWQVTLMAERALQVMSSPWVVQQSVLKVAAEDSDSLYHYRRICGSN